MEQLKVKDFFERLDEIRGGKNKYEFQLKKWTALLQPSLATTEVLNEGMIRNYTHIKVLSFPLSDEVTVSLFLPGSVFLGRSWAWQGFFVVQLDFTKIFSTCLAIRSLSLNPHRLQIPRLLI